MSLLSQLTIIVPSYNRQAYLLRSLKYWSGEEVRIIACDGTKHPISDTELANLESNIVYVHSPIALYSRLKNAVDMVATEFVMLASDDEFYISSALNACISELKKDLDLVSCGGRAIGFKYSDNLYFYPIYEKLNGLELSDNSASERVYKHFSDYVPAHLYAVNRSSAWKPIAQEIFSKEYNFFAAWEIQFEFMLPYIGKTKILDNLVWLRSSECDPIRGTSPSMSYKIIINDWWGQEVFLMEKNEFLGHMGKLAENFGLSYWELKLDFTRAINIYIHNTYDIPKTSKRKIYNCISLLAPQVLKLIVKKIINKLGTGLRRQFSLELMHMQNLGGCKIDYHELRKIELIISEFHQNRADQNSVSSI